MAKKKFNTDEQAILNVLIIKGSSGYDSKFFERYYRYEKDAVRSLKRKKMMVYLKTKKIYRVTQKGINSYYKFEDHGGY